MKTIIVPLDLSTESLAGLDLALMLADKTGANIQMVHVIGKNDDTNNELLKKEHQLIKIKIEDILQKCKEKSNFKCNMSFVIKEGKIFKEITDMADKYDDAVIVLSTHGESGFEELFIGGNAYKIVSHSRIPVITIRGNKIPFSIDKMVLPLDITFQSREKIPYTVKLAKYFNSEIHIVTVRLSNFVDVEKKILQYSKQAISYIEKHGITFTVEHLQGDNLTDMTIDYARTINADLISIMTDQEKSISNLLLGSYAHQMINKASIPVLSFPTHQITLATDGFRTMGIDNS